MAIFAGVAETNADLLVKQTRKGRTSNVHFVDGDQSTSLFLRAQDESVAAGTTGWQAMLPMLTGANLIRVSVVPAPGSEPSAGFNLTLTETSGRVDSGSSWTWAVAQAGETNVISGETFHGFLAGNLVLDIDDLTANGRVDICLHFSTRPWSDLSGVEANATADQTAAEIGTLLNIFQAPPSGEYSFGLFGRGDNNGAVLVANQIYATPIVIPAPVAWAGLVAGHQDVSAGAGQEIRYAIYSSVGSLPTTLLYESAGLDVSGGAAWYEGSFSGGDQTIGPGCYWTALNANAGGAACTWETQAMIFTPIAAYMAQFGISTERVTQVTVAQAYGAFPAAFPGGGTYANTAAVHGVALIGV